MHKWSTFDLFLIHLRRLNKDWQVEKYSHSTISNMLNKAVRIFEINLCVYFINPNWFVLYYHLSVFSKFYFLDMTTPAFLCWKTWWQRKRQIGVYNPYYYGVMRQQVLPNNDFIKPNEMCNLRCLGTENFLN